ncbi:Rossmann-fold NAD(P)-binding domain-containing protein [Dactylosporangium cerinum]
MDVLVNNAGYGHFGAVEEVTDAELEAQFATNLFAPWRLTGTGVHVVAVEPGVFATEWGTTLTESSHLDPYRDVTAPMLAGSRAMKQLPMANPPSLFADEVLRLIASDERPTRLPIGADALQALLDAAQRGHAALLNARPVTV